MNIYFNKRGWGKWRDEVVPTWDAYINSVKLWIGLIRRPAKYYQLEAVDNGEIEGVFWFAEEQFEEKDMSLIGVLFAPVNFLIITAIYLFILLLNLVLLPFAILYNIKFDFRRSKNEKIL